MTGILRDLRLCNFRSKLPCLYCSGRNGKVGGGACCSSDRSKLSPHGEFIGVGIANFLRARSDDSLLKRGCLLAQTTATRGGRNISSQLNLHRHSFLRMAATRTGETLGTATDGKKTAYYKPRPQKPALILKTVFPS